MLLTNKFIIIIISLLSLIALAGVTMYFYKSGIVLTLTLFLLFVIGLCVYYYMYPTCPICKKCKTCKTCQTSQTCQKCENTYLPIVSSDGKAHTIKLQPLTYNYVTTPSPSRKLLGTWKKMNEGSASVVCPVGANIAIIATGVDQSNPTLPLQEELLCLTPDDTNFTCRAV
jgi:hypothetical protein